MLMIASAQASTLFGLLFALTLTSAGASFAAEGTGVPPPAAGSAGRSGANVAPKATGAGSTAPHGGPQGTRAQQGTHGGALPAMRRSQPRLAGGQNAGSGVHRFTGGSNRPATPSEITGTGMRPRGSGPAMVGTPGRGRLGGNGTAINGTGIGVK